MYMDDIKLFAKKQTKQKQKTKTETLIHVLIIYSQDIGMGFGIENCAMIVMKSEQRHLTQWKRSTKSR